MSPILVFAGAAAGAAVSPVLARAATRLTTNQASLTGRGRYLLAAGAAIAGAAVTGLSNLMSTVLYAVFAAAILTAATVDAIELRIPDRITYPTMLVGVLVLPLTTDLTPTEMLAPLAGAAASGAWALVMALVADQGLGDVKLAAAIGAWTAHLGVLPWILGVLLSQIAVACVVAAAVHRNRRGGGQRGYTALGPALTVGAVLAVGAATLI